MELRNLRALVEVARCGGFSAAARVLGTTQSSVSKAVSQLEHDCGAPLVERLGRGVKLTQAGETAVRRAANMLAEQDELLAELAELRGVKAGKLRLGLPLVASSALFVRLVAAYRKRYPGIEVELHEDAARVLEEEVLKGRIEIAGSLLPVAKGLDWQLIYEEPLMALLPAEHPLRGRTSLKLAELSPAPAILLRQGFALNSIITAAYRKRRLRLAEAGRTGNPDFTIAMVAAGLGIGFLPRAVLNGRDYRSIRAVPLDEPDMRWRVALVWRKGRTLSPPAQRWVEMAPSEIGPPEPIHSKRE